MNVNRLDGSIMKFEVQPGGFYIFKPNINTPVRAYSHCTLVTTVENERMFTKIQVVSVAFTTPLL